MSVSVSPVTIQLELAGDAIGRLGVSPRELEIALRAPIGPQRLRDNTIVVDEGGWYRTITPSASWPASNEILFSNLGAGATDQEIDALIAEYHQQGLPVTWCVYPWTEPDDLGARLLARGAIPAKITAFLGTTTVPLRVFPGVEIEMIDPAATQSYEEYICLIANGYQLPADEEAFRRQRYRQLMNGPDGCLRLFLARLQGVVAGGCAVILKNDSAHMSGVYISPAFQARGLFPSLKAACLEFLRGQRIELVTGHANSQSAFWVERCGSKPIYSYTIFQLDPPEQG